MSHIETTADGHVLEIRVNRPEKRNALSPQMYADLCLALGQLDRNADLRVGLIHAEGPHFSTGIELDQWAPLMAAGEAFRVPQGGLDLFALTGPRCRKPLVIAVQGYAYTWVVELLLTTEVRVAAEDTRFGMLEVKRGIFPMGGATLRLPQQMGWANAQRYLLTGDTWSAAEAYRTGLVQAVVPPGEQYGVARDIATRIAAAAPLGVQAALRSSRTAQAEGERVAAGQLLEDVPTVMSSDDAREGVRSFLERRDAVFTGK